MRINLLLLFLFVCVISCDLFNKTEERKPLARVNASYLYPEDIEDLISEGVSKNDSTLMVQNLIDKWATQQLLVDGAEMNLNQKKQHENNKIPNYVFFTLIYYGAVLWAARRFKETKSS